MSTLPTPPAEAAPELGDVVVRHGPALTAWCGRLLGGLQAPEVDDAVQQVWLLFHRHRHELRSPEATGVWLRRAALGVCANLRRADEARRRREQAVAAEQQRRSAGQPPSAATLAELEAALARLPSGNRRVIDLHFFAGLGLGEVAERLELSPVAVRKRLQRGLAGLRREFRDRRLGALVAGLLLGILGGGSAAAATAGASSIARPGPMWWLSGTGLAVAATALAVIVSLSPPSDGHASALGAHPSSTTSSEHGPTAAAEPALPSKHTQEPPMRHSALSIPAILLAASASTAAAQESDTSASTPALDATVTACANGGCPVAGAFVNHDADSNQVLDREELLAAGNERSAQMALRYFDANSDGEITVPEYKAVIQRMQQQAQQRQGAN